MCLRRSWQSFQSVLFCTEQCGAKILEPEASQGTKSRFLADLKACGRSRELLKGKKLHSEAIRQGCDSDIYVANTLVDMYAKCGSLVDARLVFDGMQLHTVVSWNVLLMGYVENGEEEAALDLFSSISVTPDPRTFLAALKACTSLAEREEGEIIRGKLVKINALQKAMIIHCRAAGTGDVYTWSTLVDMYAKCGSLEDAHRVFNLMPCHNSVAWNSLIWGFVQGKEAGAALDLFADMQRRGCTLTALTLVAAAKACACLAVEESGKKIEGKVVKVSSLEKGIAVHHQAAKLGCDSDILLGSTLVDMYAKCGSFLDANRVFNRMSSHTVVTWNALILGHTENGEEEAALDLFYRMQSQGCEPDSRTYVALLKACAGLAAKEEAQEVEGRLVKSRSLRKGMDMHFRAANSGVETDSFVGNTLVDMYAKCGSMVHARRVFDSIARPDVISWTALMLGYSENGEEELSLELFQCMKREGCAANARTLVAALKACTDLSAKEQGIDINGKKNLKVSSLEKGLELHSEASRCGYDLNDVYVASSLVSMYAACGSLENSRKVFDRMNHRDSVLWKVLMLRYVGAKEAGPALELYNSIRLTNSYQPDSSTFSIVLKACALQASLQAAKGVNADICRGGFEQDPGLINSLVDAYGKSGSMVDAQHAFDSVTRKNLLVVTWNSLLSGYSQQGNSIEQLFTTFSKMQLEGFKPDGVTLNSVLSACSHTGLVDTGTRYFNSMRPKYGIRPDLEHYTCVIDMLGRHGQVEAAVEMIQKIPDVDSVAWMSVLDNCCKWDKTEVAKLALETFLRLESQNSQPQND